MKTTATLHTNRHARGTQSQHGRFVTVLGYELEAGDVIEPTDLYDSTCGYWHPAPVAGITLGVGIATKWVRPTEENQ